MEEAERPLFWVGSAKTDLRAFPDEVKDVMGYALHRAQRGGKHRAAKPLKGHKGAGVLEIVDDHDGDTYRAVYTIRFASGVYVLHAFQKKSRKGRATDRTDLDMVARRLKLAEADDARRRKESDRDD